MEHAIDKIIKKPTLEGQVGESHIWDGPLDTSGFPMGKGSSSGIKGMQIKKYPCKSYDLQGPITSTELEMSLKILLLIVTIGYTVTKWIDLRKNK
jgi:hypothetical protein